jgi:hypothetical protein
MLLTAEQILGADDLPYEDAPAWGGTVRIRRLGAIERRQFEKKLGEPNDDVDTRTRLVGMCLAGEDNAPLFSEAQLAALAKKSSTEIADLFDVAKRLNRIGDEEKKIQKNSPSPAANSDSNSN